jgi:hypothetical protein
MRKSPKVKIQFQRTISLMSFKISDGCAIECVCACRAEMAKYYRASIYDL